MGRPKKKDLQQQRRKIEEVAVLAERRMAESMEQRATGSREARDGSEIGIQTYIARELGIGRHTVSRYLKKAEQLGYLRRYHCPLEDERKQQVLQAVFSRDVVARLHELADRQGVPRVQAVHVFAPGGGVETDEDWDHQTLRFGEMAADTLWDYIQRAETVGVTFGRILASLVRGLRRRADDEAQTSTSRSSTAVRPTQFVPLWGDAVTHSAHSDSSVWTDPDELDSSTLAGVLHRIANADVLRDDTVPKANRLSLHGVPALRPLDFDKRQFAAVLKFHARFSSYREIFGDRKLKEFGVPAEGKVESGDDEEAMPWADRIDCLLASVGSPQQPSRVWSDEFFRLGGINKGQLLASVCGDLAGIWIERREQQGRSITAAERAYLKKIRGCWTGIDVSVLERCAQRGFDGQGVGVVAVAVGHQRCEAVVEAARRGWINILLIDSTCARAVVQWLDKSAGQ